jgi:integrase
LTLFFENIHIIPIPYGSHLETCPVRALQDWLELSQINQGPLFRAINKLDQISSRGMCAAAIAQIVKSYTWEGKRDQYSGHSLRAGFCTQASANGVSDTQGMKHSRHKHHDTWRKYVRFASVWQDNAATKLGL